MQAGVKVSRNAVPGPGNLSLYSTPVIVPAAKLLDFTAGTHVPWISKLATFAIVIR